MSGNGLQVQRWTDESLRAWARAHAYEGQVLVLANCEPYRHDPGPGGAAVLRHSTSGLVTALEPLIRATSGVWIAHGSGLADHLTVEHDDGLDVPPHEPRYRLRRVWLSNSEVRRYYEGFANEGLWPLCHRSRVRPVFRMEDLITYRETNRRFVDRLVAEARSDAPVVFVQDYHFALAPRMVRERLPASTIAAFWHIPWPAWQTFDACPWGRQLVEGLLGADVLGFQTPGDCENFLETAERLLDALVSSADQSVIHAGRRTEVRAYPASIEWPSRWAAQAPAVEVCRREIRSALGIVPNAQLSVGVARLDYTKGIEETFCAVERLLEHHPEYRGTFTHVQLAEPSRMRVAAYRELADRVVGVADRVNGRFGQGSYRPVILLRDHHEPPEVYRFLRAADVCYVGSLHDGMNLVAKEFIAARDDERGALVLSVFAGAAWQLPDALVVNPYDLDEVVTALRRALRMTVDEQRDRLSRMRALIAEENAHKWAVQILSDLSRIRRCREAVAQGSTPSLWS